MSLIPITVRTACCTALILALTTQLATAGQHRAQKHLRAVSASQRRPWDANAAMMQQAADPWWAGRLVEAPPWSFACTTDHGPSRCGQPIWVYGNIGN